MNGARRFLSISFALVVAGAVVSSAAVAQEARRGVMGSLALELNGSSVGFLRGAEGGDVRAEVITQAMGWFPKKQLAQPTVEDLKLELGPDMDKAVYDWIAASWKGNFSLANGAVMQVNYDSNVLARREFSSASVVGTTIPALDASSKDPGYLMLAIHPESVRMTKGGGTVSPTLGGRSRPWITSNFRVDIPGLDCSRIKKVGGFTVTIQPKGSIQFPNLKLTMAESSAESWIAWHKSFVVDGLNGDNSEKDGAIIFLAADMGTEIGRISLSHLGISSLTFDNPEGASNMIRTVTAELYCEGMAFQWTGGSGGNVLNTRTLIR